MNEYGVRRNCTGLLLCINQRFVLTGTYTTEAIGPFKVRKAHLKTLYSHNSTTSKLTSAGRDEAGAIPLNPNVDAGTPNAEGFVSHTDPSNAGAGFGTNNIAAGTAGAPAAGAGCRNTPSFTFGTESNHLGLETTTGSSSTVPYQRMRSRRGRMVEGG